MARLRHVWSGLLSLVRLRRASGAGGLEVWLRHDVAGHSVNCSGRPTEFDGLVLRCSCYACAWRRL